MQAASTIRTPSLRRRVRRRRSRKRFGLTVDDWYGAFAVERGDADRAERYEHRGGGSGGSADRSVLRHGRRAVPSSYRSPARWCTVRGRERTDFVFRGDVSAQHQSEIRNEMERRSRWRSSRSGYVQSEPPKFVVVAEFNAGANCRVGLADPSTRRLIVPSPDLVVGSTHRALSTSMSLQWHLRPRLAPGGAHRACGDRRHRPRTQRSLYAWSREATGRYAEARVPGGGGVRLGGFARRFAEPQRVPPGSNGPSTRWAQH